MTMSLHNTRRVSSTLRRYPPGRCLCNANGERWARNLVLDWLSCKTEGRKAASCHMWTCVVMPALGSGCHFEPLRRLLSYTRGTRIMAWKVSRFMVFAREQTIKDQSFFFFFFPWPPSPSFCRGPNTARSLRTTSGRPTEHDIVV